DVTFDGTTSSDPELVWFIQSDDLSLINDLSALDKYKTIQAQGILFGDISIDDDGSAGSNGGVFNLTLKIPEPSTQAGLLGIGAFGALLLLKNKLRLRKPF
ncbi:MAG: PEP-CTERM sorting domain-containing protein, partial [Scytonema sp. CRU_2_7]|nr:PEP-CTERM sorting domain-containing protein [Scytonema sp. CRU_2_7]